MTDERLAAAAPRHECYELRGRADRPTRDGAGAALAALPHRLFRGSVAEEVAGRAGVPVLLSRSGDRTDLPTGSR